ncbi:uncharacterized protein PAF06_006483 [Gastrophryne carolinensis]
MMPGETHSNVGGIASEAAASCQNCTSLQLSLNEYVAALITLKQKIIDSDHLLKKYQQNFDDLQSAKRENETLRCQLEQILEKISPQEQIENKLISLSAELEEKSIALKAFQQTQLQCVKIKEQYKESSLTKKKLKAKLKKMEETAEKHIKDIRKLQLEKTFIGKELKKMQKRLEIIQNGKCIRAVKNAETQVANEQSFVKLNKKKIKILLEELWGCIESSTENGDDDQLILETKLESSNTERSFECTSSLGPNNSSLTFNTASESNFVSKSNEFAQNSERKPYDKTRIGVLYEETPKNELKDLNDACLLNSDSENVTDDLVKILNWAKPLPHLLSPLTSSPLMIKDVFGEFDDSGGDELSDSTVKNKTMHCKIANQLSDKPFQSPSMLHSVKAQENVLENCTQSDGHSGDLKIDIECQSKSDISFDADKLKVQRESPKIEFGSNPDPKDNMSHTVSNESLVENPSVLPVDVNDFLGERQIKDMQASEDRSSFEASQLSLSCSPAVNRNKTEFPSDAFLNKSYLNMTAKECDMTQSYSQCNEEKSGSVDFTEPLAERTLNADTFQTKMTPNYLDIVAEYKESNSSESLHSKSSSNVSGTKAGCKSQENKDADHRKCVNDTDKEHFNQQSFISQTEKLQQFKDEACETDTTGNCCDVNEFKMGSSETEKPLPANVKSSNTQDMSKAQNIVLANVQFTQTQMYVNEIWSHSEYFYDYPRTQETNDLLHMNDKVAEEINATNGSKCEAKLQTKDSRSLLCNYPLTEDVNDLITDRNDNNKKFSRITNKPTDGEDICVSLDSEEEDTSLVRKVSNTRAFSNPLNFMKSCRSSLENINKKVCNLDFRLDNGSDPTIYTSLVHKSYARALPTCENYKNKCNSSDSVNGVLIEQDSSDNVIVDTERDTSNADIVTFDSDEQRKKESSLLVDSEKQDGTLVSEPCMYINSNAGIICDILNTKSRNAQPGKNQIWNIERTHDFLDFSHLRKQKLKANSETIHVASSNIFSKISVTEEMPAAPIPTYKVKQVVRKEKTLLVNADTSSSSDCSPESIIKVRSEIGPPLPPLLGPLLATPTRMIPPVSPTKFSSLSSLPSLDELISPLPGTQFPLLMSPLSDSCKHSLALTAMSNPEKANAQILSSPLQFCTTTPKHALPVPGRLPLSASGTCATSVQENSVKILDTIYPELSARARTLNILKGHVQLNQGLPDDSKNIHISQITGFKSITSTPTAFIKTGNHLGTASSTMELRRCENQVSPSSNLSLNKRTADTFLMPKSAKRLCLDSESPVMETVNVNFTICAKEVQKSSEYLHKVDHCELLPDIVKDSSVDEDAITNALKKIEDLCFDLLPVIRSHIFVGNIPKIPVMRNEEKEVIYEFSSLKSNLADHFLHVVLKKIRAGKASMPSSCLQALCRVYVGLCRQLGDIERARILCYSILKEDFPDADKLLLFIVSSWNDILSTHGVLSKAIQVILRTLAKEEVGYCLSAYLGWEKANTPPMNVNVLLSSVLMAIQLYPDVKFQQSEKYGEDLPDSVWEYVFAVDLLCSYRKWVWTHDNVISKELWPILDKWVKRKKGNPNVTFVPDVIVAAVLRLIGRLCQMGLKEGFITAVKNIGTVIITFLQHANEEGMPWGMQLACVYMLCNLAPSDPATIFKTLQAWKDASKNVIPPAIGICFQELESTCELKK